MPFGSIASAAIGAAGKIVGGIIGSNAASSNASAANAMAMEQFYANQKLQKEFAQHGIRWKVADAKAAGLHPLAALGSNFASYTPSYPNIGGGYDGDYGISDALSQMGQGVGRATQAKATQEERARIEAQRAEHDSLVLEGLKLDNQEKELQIQIRAADLASRTGPHALPPAMPSLRTRADGAVIGTVMPGQADSSTSSLFTVKPAEITANTPGYPGTEAGTITDIGFARTNDGGYVPVQSKDMKERLEEDLIGEIGWNIRNRLPALIDSSRVSPPRDYLPSPQQLYSWEYDTLRGAWYPVRRRSDYHPESYRTPD